MNEFPFPLSQFVGRYPEQEFDKTILLRKCFGLGFLFFGCAIFIQFSPRSLLPNFRTKSQRVALGWTLLYPAHHHQSHPQPGVVALSYRIPSGFDCGSLKSFNAENEKNVDVHFWLLTLASNRDFIFLMCWSRFFSVLPDRLGATPKTKKNCPVSSPGKLPVKVHLGSLVWFGNISWPIELASASRLVPTGTTLDLQSQWRIMILSSFSAAENVSFLGKSRTGMTQTPTKQVGFLNGFSNQNIQNCRSRFQEHAIDDRNQGIADSDLVMCSGRWNHCWSKRVLRIRPCGGWRRHKRLHAHGLAESWKHWKIQYRWKQEALKHCKNLLILVDTFWHYFSLTLHYYLHLKLLLSFWDSATLTLRLRICFFGVRCLRNQKDSKSMIEKCSKSVSRKDQQSSHQKNIWKRLLCEYPQTPQKKT